MTSLVRFSPSSELSRMQREIDQLFKDFSLTGGADTGPEAAVWTPRADVHESDEAYVIFLNIPGVKKDDVQIAVQDGRLTITGDTPVQGVKEDMHVVRTERLTGSFYRSFALPQKIDDNSIEAEYRDGVLKVFVPKAEESKPRRIQIN